MTIKDFNSAKFQEYNFPDLRLYLALLISVIHS